MSRSRPRGGDLVGRTAVAVRDGAKSAASARQAAVWRLSLGGERRCAVPLAVGLWGLPLLS